MLPYATRTVSFLGLVSHPKVELNIKCRAQKCDGERSGQTVTSSVNPNTHTHTGHTTECHCSSITRQLSAIRVHYSETHS